MNRSRHIVLAALALALSACGSEDGENAGNTEVVPDALRADVRGQQQIEVITIEDSPAAIGGGQPAAVPAGAGRASPGDIGEAATTIDGLADWDLPYYPNCWPLHECMIEE